MKRVKVNRNPTSTETANEMEKSKRLLEGVKQSNEERVKVPLRINERTVFLVSPEHCNESYAETIRQRMEHTRNFGFKVK